MNDNRDIFEKVAYGEATGGIVEFQNEARFAELKKAAEMASVEILKFQAKMFGKERFHPTELYQVPFEDMFAKANPIIMEMKMTKEETFYFAFLILSELKKGYPKVEA